MSVVVGLKKEGKVYMGADSYIGADTRSDVTAEPKLFKKGNLIIGVTGLLRLTDVLANDFTVPVRQKRKQAKTYIKIDVVNAIFKTLERNGLIIEDQEEKVDKFDGEIMLGYEGELYLMDEQFGCTMSAMNYSSIGSASDVALGCLFETDSNNRLSPESKLTRALKACCQHSNQARPPFIFENA